MASRRAGGSLCRLAPPAEVTTPCSRQTSRRTAANVSEKVGCGLRHHVQVAVAWRISGVSWAASSVVSENRPSRRGVVRAAEWSATKRPSPRTSWVHEQEFSMGRTR